MIENLDMNKLIGTTVFYWHDAKKEMPKYDRPVLLKREPRDKGNPTRENFISACRKIDWSDGQDYWDYVGKVFEEYEFNVVGWAYLAEMVSNDISENKTSEINDRFEILDL
jgi:hypothetical protein